MSVLWKVDAELKWRFASGQETTITVRMNEETAGRLHAHAEGEEPLIPERLSTRWGQVRIIIDEAVPDGDFWIDEGGNTTDGDPDSG